MKKFKEYLLENGISLTDQEIQQAFGYHKLGRTSFGESIRMVLGSQYENQRSKRCRILLNKLLIKKIIGGVE